MRSVVKFQEFHKEPPVLYQGEDVLYNGNSNRDPQGTNQRLSLEAHFTYQSIGWAFGNDYGRESKANRLRLGGVNERWTTNAVVIIAAVVLSSFMR